MKFGPVPLHQAEGKILAHHIAGPDGLRAYRKGKPLTAVDVAGLRELGRGSVYVAELEIGDVAEDHAAGRISRAIRGNELELSKPQVGRVNIRARRFGVLRVEIERLTQLNDCEGITVATLAAGSVVHPGDTVATVKVIPFSVPEVRLRQVEAICQNGGALICVQALATRKVSLILSGSVHTRQRVLDSFLPPLKKRVEALGSEIRAVDFVPLEDELGEEHLAETLRKEVGDGSELIILAGETAIMDRYDITPRAVERAGGRIVCFGAPVDPGNLLMLAYLGDVPILGAPGCARSPKTNVVDWVLPRLLAGEPLSRADIVSLGHGGLLEDTPLRPMPRNHQS
jgi:molybdenum cofactor cytidylyltransferase